MKLGNPIEEYLGSIEWKKASSTMKLTSVISAFCMTILIQGTDVKGYLSHVQKIGDQIVKDIGVMKNSLIGKK